MKVPCRVFGRARTSILNYAICLGLGLFLLRPWVSHVAPVRSFSPALESLSRGDRFVLVFPVVAKDIAKMETILDTYGAVGQPCSGRFTAVTDFYFLYNLIQDGTVDALNRKLAQSSSFRKMSRCFHETGVVFANLSGIEDEYPAGPSNMFFKLIESPDLKWFRSRYKLAFWAESDVEPIRPMWADALYIEATLPTSYNGLEPDYWMKGSVYRGRGFDQAVLYRENWNWVDHLNGNAFYRLNDPEFEDFVRITKEYEPPNDYWKPFDIAMMRVLNSNPYGWVIRQYAARKFVSTDFIQHFGFSSDAATAAALSNRRTSFIHGKPGSAGDVAYKAKYNALGQPRLRNVSEAEKLGAIRPEHKLCVLLRTFKVDLPYAKLAAKSALKHIWHLNELVVVVVQKDLDLAQKAFEGKDFLQVRVVAEQEVLQNGHMQQKYTKLNADIYCPKDTRYVFHLDSDVVLTRPLLVRDVFFRGRPMVQYAPYESMPSGDRQWQAGTSSAVKQSVTLEFSRTNAHVYPIEAYSRVRAFLEKAHGVSLIDFLRTRRGRLMEDAFEAGNFSQSTVTTDNLFSDFNTIGAYLYHYERHLVSFVPFYVNNPTIITSFADVFPVTPWLVCQGNARLNLDYSMVAYGLSLLDRELAALKRAMDGGWEAGCWEVIALFQELQKRAITAQERFQREKPK